MSAYFMLLGNIPLSMQLFISEDKMFVNMSALSFNSFGGMLLLCINIANQTMNTRFRNI